MKKIVITISNGEENKECTIGLPLVIANQLGDEELRNRLETLFADLLGMEVIQVEMVEEIRHEFRRRWDDPKP